MSRYWRPGFLVILLVGPILAYVGFGALWLRDHGWLLIASVIWISSGILFSILAARWTRKETHVLPPIDWDRPETFSKSDGEAWKIVEDEADRGEAVSLDELSRMDIYIDVGRRLANRLAAHYHPESEDPIQLLPVVDLLTALELASEDLNQLCKQIPGGDMITPGHWKKAVQVANYFQRANDIYSYLLPIFSPMTGLARLGSQHLMVKPAWKNMQQNLLRWFFQAYVNRLGMHLIELYSGRLAMGARQYRRLTPRASSPDSDDSTDKPRVKIGVAGMRGVGKSRLISQVRAAQSGDLSQLKARLESEGLDPSVIDTLKAAEWIEIPGYGPVTSGETSSDPGNYRAAVEAARKMDFLVLVSNATAESVAADTAFAKQWDHWFEEHPAAEIPSAIDVVNGIDSPELGGDWRPPYSWLRGQSPREAAIRAKVNALRGELPKTFTAVVPVSLGDDSYGVADSLIPTLLSNLQRAERAAMFRQFSAAAGGSKAVRLIKQVGSRGQAIWRNLKAAKEARDRRGTETDRTGV